MDGANLWSSAYWMWVFIPIAAILAWGAIKVTKAIVGGRQGGTDAAALAEIHAKLDASDGRLAVVEKAINDIP